MRGLLVAKLIEKESEHKTKWCAYLGANGERIQPNPVPSLKKGRCRD